MVLFVNIQNAANIVFKIQKCVQLQKYRNYLKAPFPMTKNIIKFFLQMISMNMFIKKKIIRPIVGLLSSFTPHCAHDYRFYD
jgi:hypothetical protein